MSLIGRSPRAVTTATNVEIAAIEAAKGSIFQEKRQDQSFRVDKAEKFPDEARLKRLGGGPYP